MEFHCVSLSSFGFVSEDIPNSALCVLKEVLVSVKKAVHPKVSSNLHVFGFTYLPFRL